MDSVRENQFHNLGFCSCSKHEKNMFYNLIKITNQTRPGCENSKNTVPFTIEKTKK